MGGGKKRRAAPGKHVRVAELVFCNALTPEQQDGLGLEEEYDGPQPRFGTLVSKVGRNCWSVKVPRVEGADFHWGSLAGAVRPGICTRGHVERCC